ncbi:hypothetical protein [Rickettsiella massiliensis]|uniref:hypothetical protein n=1 Tax=Rickettsiella massiliensis TaxID=676517 RepID=UPI00029A9304|nr:hypothetical protein [Rickettsiella massiliensis]
MSLRYAVDYIARKNAWPVPTGIQMLARSLDRLPVANEAQLLEILVQVKTMIEGRIKLRYLTRDLEPLSIWVQEGQLNS